MSISPTCLKILVQDEQTKGRQKADRWWTDRSLRILNLNRHTEYKCMVLSVCMKETLGVCMCVRDSISQMDEVK